MLRNETRSVSERFQDAFQRRRISLKSVESSEQSLLEFTQGFEEPIVGSFSSGFFPDIFGRIEFWRVRGQIVEFNTALTIEPLPYFWALVILGVVQDQVYLLILVSRDKLVKKAQKTLGVEPVDEPKVKFGIITDCYRSHHFQGFPCGWSLHYTSDTLQGPMSKSNPLV